MIVSSTQTESDRQPLERQGATPRPNATPPALDHTPRRNAAPRKAGLARRPPASSPPGAGGFSSASKERASRLPAETLWSRAAARSPAAGLLLTFLGPLCVLAPMLLLPVAAEAQTTVWSGTLTVKNSVGLLGCSNGFGGSHCSDYLSDDDFTHDSTDYAIHTLWVRTTGRLELVFDTDLTTATQALTLNLDGTAFAFEDADDKGDDFRRWDNSGLSWIAGETVSATLTAAGTTTDTTAPAFASAAANGASLVITFDEDLAAAASLANSAFTVKKTASGGSEATVALSTTVAPVISGTTVTLTLGTALVSTDGSVKVTYTKPTTGSANKLVDAASNETATFTDQTVTNNTPAVTNNAPVFNPSAVNRSVAENTGSGQIQTKTGVTYDHEAKASYAVTVTASDGTDSADATVTISVTDVNEPPAAPAAPAVAGVSGSSTNLEVSWTAPPNDGKPAIASYDVQYRQGTSGNFTNGPQDATGTSATIMSLTADTLYQVQVRATNAEGDSVWSASGSGTTATAPVAPAAPTVAAVNGSTRSLAVSWIAPADGGSAITGYDVQYREGTSGDFTSWPLKVTGTSLTISGLTQNTLYQVQVRATNADTTPPALVAAFTDASGADIHLQFSENLQESNLPPASAFTVTAGGSAVSVTAVDRTTLNNDRVKITVSPVVRQGQAVVVAYADPTAGDDANAIQDALGNDAASFTTGFGGAVAVNNFSTVAPAAPTAPTVAGVSGSSTSLAVSWSAPADNGSAITSYDLQYQQDGSTDWTDGPQDQTGLMASNLYQVQVRATNAEGDSDWSASGSGTTGTTATAPTGAAVWSGTLTVRDSLGSLGCSNGFSGSYCSDYLSDDDFTHDSTGYTITTLWVLENGRLQLIFDPVPEPDPPADTLALALTLNLDGTAFAFEDADSKGVHFRRWNNSGLSWTVGATVLATVTAAGTTNAVQTATAPAAPTVAGVSGSTTSLTVSWSAPANNGSAITSYDLQYRQGTSGDFTDGPQNVNGTSSTLTVLAANTLYQVQVRATNAEGDSAWSPSGSGTTNAVQTATAPAAPTVAGVSGSTTSLTVSWSAPADNGSAITSYDLQYRQGTSGNFTDGPQNVVATSAVITGLAANSPYQVQVRATNAEGDSAWSDHGTGSTGNSLSVITQVMGVRIVPGDAQLVVSWTAVDTATGYTVQWKSGGVNYNTGDRQVTVTPGSTTRYTISGLTNGTEYTVRVIATRTDANDGPPSAEVTATPDVVAPRPPPPPPDQENNFPTADAGPDQTGLWEGALVLLDGSGSSHPEDEQLRYRWNQLSGQPVALSSQDIVNPTFRAPQELTADAVLQFRLLVTDPSGRFDSDTVTVTVDPEAEPPAAGDHIYYFPHLAVGEGWQTTITYINYSPQEVSCRTEFLSDQGTPLMVSFAERGTVLRWTDLLPPGGSVHQETNVELSAPLVRGWARATCTEPVKASLLYRRFEEGVPSGEAGVNATTVPASRFVTFAEQGEGRLGTGVAYANPSDTAAVLTFTARDADGEVLASVDETLLPNGHDAQNMAPLFGLSSFSGSIEVTSTTPIVSLSLNAEAELVFSSLPPGELDAAVQGPQGMTTYYFTHLAVGASWQTTITYINYSPQIVTCETDFISDFGSPLMVSFADRGTVISRSDVVPTGGSVHEETNVELSTPLARGWARATCSGPVKASLLYRRFEGGVPTGEAGVNATTVPATRFVTFAEQGEGRYGTGVAYANPSDTTTAFVTFTAKDTDGEVLASVDETLLPNGHDAQNMVELFDLGSFSGSLEVTSTAPIVSLSLNNEADPVFSSLPPGEVDDAVQ